MSTTTDDADTGVKAQQFADRVDQLASLGAEHLDLDQQIQMLSSRRAAGRLLRNQAPFRETWPPPYPDAFPEVEGIPEISVEELSAETIGGAVLHRGALLVRGLADRTRAATLRDATDSALSGYQAWQESGGTAEPTSWFRPFNPMLNPGMFLGYGETWLRLVDSPLAAALVAETCEVLRQPFLEYFGGRPVLASSKWSLRHSPADVVGSYHQDGQFMGTDMRTLNLWMALSDCGVDAPGLDLVDHRINEMLADGDNQETLTWCITDDTVARVAGPQGVAQPIYAAGDGLIFDHYTVHNVGIRPGATRSRYALESWFFDPAAFPTMNLPILF